MNPSISIIFIICLVAASTGLPIKGCKSRPTSGKNVGKADNTETEEPLDVFSKILKVNTGMDKSTHPIVYGDVMKRMGRYATNRNRLWPRSADGTVQVPYTLSPGYRVEYQNLFMTAMQEFESLTCVRFIKRTAEVNYLDIISSDGCSSYVGQNGGAQPVRLLAPGCMSRGIIQHELNHALGFQHENSRSDRGSYITVNYRNVKPGMENNFDIQDGTTLGLPYDYTSVMHYDKFAFAIDPNLPTISTIPNPNVQVGQRDGLSVLDVEKINKFYNCDVSSRLFNTPGEGFSSANYPNNYPDNMNFAFLIRTPDRQVSLRFDVFKLQSSPDCSSDYVRIFDGPSRRSPLLLNNTCGSSQIPTIIGSTNQMLMEFVSDGSNSSSGFSASYKTVQCGGTFFAATNNITSPGYSSGSYLPNLNCYFTIHAPTGYKISLNGTFDIESAIYCYADSLLVYGSGEEGESPTNTFCGTGLISMTSTGNKILLNFQTDGGYQRKGFRLTYTIFKET
ncbi:embryonic protein UVS.2-like [Bufo gargarizans]|uniref:embryonic protein UVS.2-like n=1 Tax=Bufo gargarizans TaxID=30331 RepID=UPI001CF13B95|nr:embryonic protein UVS.2-like [Bufo gargarizans]